MNLHSDTWVAGKDYTAAPTCTTCHMGAAGKVPTTHDVGLRNAWSLNTPVSMRQYLVVLDDGSKLELPPTREAAQARQRTREGRRHHRQGQGRGDAGAAAAR
jgi:hydroxylamine dehydrogenase